MAILDLPGHRSLRSWRAPEPENTPDCDPVRIRTLLAPTSFAADPLWLLDEHLATQGPVRGGVGALGASVAGEHR
jgi:hypothetical protein